MRKCEDSKLNSSGVPKNTISEVIHICCDTRGQDAVGDSNCKYMHRVSIPERHFSIKICTFEGDE